MQWGVRPLVFAATAVGPQRAAWCSPMATMARQILAAAVRFWFLATSSLVRAPGWRVLPSAVAPRRVRCRLLAAAVVRQRLAAADRPSFQEESFSAPVL